MDNFANAHKEIRQEISKESGILDLFHLMRYSYVKPLFEDKTFSLWFDNVREDYKFENRKYVEQSLKGKIKKKLSKYIREKKLSWNNCNFHEQYRITNQKAFNIFVLEILRETSLMAKNTISNTLFETISTKIKEEDNPLDIIKKFKDNNEIKQNENFYKFIKLSEKIEEVQKVLDEGYDMSIIPLNMLLPEETLMKYIPEKDYFEKTPRSINPDPYGHEFHKIKGESGLILGTYMFKHSFLLDIQSFCPVGCVGCYKTYYTREKEDRLGLSSITVETQAKETVRWLNQHPEVYDIIISGGEPLLIDLDNSKIEILFGYLREAKYLKVVRICTGLLFQGIPFRIDKPLLDIIKDFSMETGKRFAFHAHLTNHCQLTPESLYAVKKIKEEGFNIYSQVPIQEGINFFRDNEKKTAEFLVKLGRYQVRAGIEPYKYIVDMHPRTQKRYVPIEKLLSVWRKLGESHLYPELERPRTLSILCKQGNIILSWYMLKHMKKRVNREKDEVVYQIPAIVGTGGSEEVKLVEYAEPIIPGINDEPNSVRG